MKNSTANAVDFEHQDGRIIEIGLTTVDLEELEVIQSYSIPIWDSEYPIELRREIKDLTGWTENKLKKSGIPLKEALHRLKSKYGAQNRLCITDSWDELSLIGTSLLDMDVFDQYGLCPIRETMNVTTLWKIKTGNFYPNLDLRAMLAHFDLEFEGREHSAKDDSLNIARLFTTVMRTK